MYYLYHIRKTGGRSIIHSFLELASNNPEQFYERLARQPGHKIKQNEKIFIGWDTSTLKRGKFFFAFSHDPSYSINLPPKTYTITCLREPLSRLISYYNYIMGIKDAVKKDPKHVHANMQDLTWAHKDQIKFLRTTPKRHLLNQLFMFSRSMKPAEAVNNIAKISLIMHTESMHSDINRLSKATKIKLQPLHFGATKVKRTITDDFMVEANRILKPEFDLMDHLKTQGLLK